MSHTGAAALSSEDVLAVASRGGDVALFDLEGGRSSALHLASRQRIKALFWYGSRPLLAIVLGGEIQLWKISMKEGQRLLWRHAAYSDARLMPGFKPHSLGRDVLALPLSPRRIAIFEASADRKKWRERARIEEKKHAFEAISWSPFRGYLLLSTSDGRLRTFGLGSRSGTGVITHRALTPLSWVFADHSPMQLRYFVAIGQGAGVRLVEDMVRPGGRGPPYYHSLPCRRPQRIVLEAGARSMAVLCAEKQPRLLFRRGGRWTSVPIRSQPDDGPIAGPNHQQMALASAQGISVWKISSAEEVLRISLRAQRIFWRSSGRQLVAVGAADGRVHQLEVAAGLSATTFGCVLPP